MEDFPLFDPDFPQIRLIWDATALSELLRDPVMFQLKMIDGYRADMEQAALIWGQWYHAGLEARNRALMRGESPGAACAYAQQAILPAQEIKWKEVGDKYRSYESLFNAVTAYCDYYHEANDEFLVLPDGSPCVEQEFLLPLILPNSDECLRSPSGRPYMIAGYFDGVRVLDKKRLVVNEIKHTTSTLDHYLSDFVDSLQLHHYGIAVRVLFPQFKIGSIVVDACQLFVENPQTRPEAMPPRFIRREFLLSLASLEGHLRDVIMWIKLAEVMATGHRADLSGIEAWWPRRRQKWGPGKDWWGVLKEPPKMRKAYAEANFPKESPWDPRKIRGD